MQSSYFVGLDLGQSADPTAVAVLERTAEPEAVEWSYKVRHLQRFPLGTKYPVIVSEVKELLGKPPLPGCSLVVDQTGCGRPVCDMLQNAGLPAQVIPVTITAGHGATFDAASHSWHVPKQDLITTLLVLFQSHRLTIAWSLPEAATLVQELENFRVKVTPAANEVFNAREGKHDDLLLAVAIAAWFAERPVPKLETIDGPLVLNGPPLGETPEQRARRLMAERDRWDWRARW